MSDDPANLVLVCLRRIDAKIDGLVEAVDTVKVRVTQLELGMANVRSEIAGLHHAYAGLQVQFDHVGKRLERIERRLDLHEPAA